MLKKKSGKVLVAEHFLFKKTYFYGSSSLFFAKFLTATGRTTKMAISQVFYRINTKAGTRRIGKGVEKIISILSIKCPNVQEKYFRLEKMLKGSSVP